MKRKVLLFFLTLCTLLQMSHLGFAQESTVTGTVTDGQSGEPLANVSIVIQGQKTGTLTDEGGRFALSAATGSTLIFSRIDYETATVKVAGKTLNVTLSKGSKALGEVVVVGYGKQNKATLAGSATIIGEKQIRQQVANNVGQMLQGTVSGLTVFRNSGDPSSDYNIFLRGLSSVNNPARPLIMIDGVPGKLSDVSQNMIESITVLKDATTAGIYGSSSAGGVILITTKSGTGKPKLSIGYNVGMDNFVNLMKQLRGDDFMRLQNESLVNAGNMPFWTDQQIDSVGAGTNWIDAVTRTGVRHELNLDYSGSSKGFTYLVSGNYLKEDAAVKGNWYERVMLRAKLNSQVTSWLNLGLNVQGTFAKGRGGADVLSAGTYSPAILLDKGGLPNLRTTGAAGYLTGRVNPIQALEDSIRGYSNNNPTYTMNAFFTPEITFSPHLKFNSIINTGINFLYSKAFYGSYNLYDASNTVLIGQRTQANTQASATAAYTWSVGIQNYFTYANTFAADHKVEVVAGHRESKTNLGATLSNTKYNFSNNLLRNISNGQERDNAAGTDYTPTTKRSFFGRVNYQYREKYIFEGTLSYDGTDRFGPNNKYGLFPAASVAWVVSREPFLQTSKWLDNLKLRASYGVLGNDAIPQFQYYQTIRVSGAYPFGSPNYPSALGAFPSSVANPNVQWESTATLNFGADLSFLKNWNLALDYYERNTYNMLFNTPVSQTTGFSSQYLNIGNVRNNGIEIALGYRKTWSDWTFNAHLTLAKNTNKVTKLFNGLTKYIYGATKSSAFITGEPTSLVYGVKVLGIYQTAEDLVKYPRKGAKVGDYIFNDVKRDSLLSSDDFEVLGNSFPMITAGLNAGLSWRNLELSMTLSGAFDYDVVNESAGAQVTSFNFLYPNSNERWLTYYNNRWRGPGTSETQPQLLAYNTRNYQQGVRSTDLRNGNFIRVRNIQLGYTFNQQLLSRFHIAALRLFLNASNPLLFSKYYGYDPETAGYPVMRTTSLGLNATF